LGCKEMKDIGVYMMVKGGWHVQRCVVHAVEASGAWGARLWHMLLLRPCSTHSKAGHTARVRMCVETWMCTFRYDHASTGHSGHQGSRLTMSHTSVNKVIRYVISGTRENREVLCGMCEGAVPLVVVHCSKGPRVTAAASCHCRLL